MSAHHAQSSRRQRSIVHEPGFRRLLGQIDARCAAPTAAGSGSTSLRCDALRLPGLRAPDSDGAEPDRRNLSDWCRESSVPARVLPAAKLPLAPLPRATPSGCAPSARCTRRAATRSKRPGSQRLTRSPTTRCSGLPSGPERRSFAAWVPKSACAGALVPAHSRRSTAVDHLGAAALLRDPRALAGALFVVPGPICAATPPRFRTRLPACKDGGNTGLVDRQQLALPVRRGAKP